MSENKNYLDLVTYLLIYAAHADSEFTDSEKATIIEKVSAPEYEKMKALYDGHNDAQSIDWIKEQSAFWLQTEESKKNLMRNISDTIKADHKLDITETAFIRLLGRIL